MNTLKVGDYVTAIDPCEMDEEDYLENEPKVYALTVGKKYKVINLAKHTHYVVGDFCIESDGGYEHWFEFDSEYFEETKPKDYLREAVDLLEDVMADIQGQPIDYNLAEKALDFIKKHKQKV
ncbi:MAG: hypothetical protein GY928_28710 [Colwellia sp.]|nr:hypothetical protein [Colwellia sp.]